MDVSRRMLRTLALIAAIPLAAACGDDPEAPQQTDLPDADAAALWSYLQEQGYQQNWALWPGKGELYEGSTKHGAWLTTYLNNIALDALQGDAGTMPDGAIIVKENYMPDSTFASVTTMYKVAGYNPEHNDWYWTKFSPDGSALATGKVDGCITCHAAVAGNDYIYTTPLE